MKNSIRSRVLTCLLALAAIGTLMTSMTSCQQELLYSQEPSYEKMFFSADSIDFHGEIHATMTFNPGQKVYVGILIADDGAYITRSDQTWTLRGYGIDDVVKTMSVVAPCGKEPTWSFYAPNEPGEYSVSFKEKYNFSASKPDGTIFGQSATMSAKFRVR